MTVHSKSENERLNDLIQMFRLGMKAEKEELALEKAIHEAIKPQLEEYAKDLTEGQLIGPYMKLRGKVLTDLKKLSLSKIQNIFKAYESEQTKPIFLCQLIEDRTYKGTFHKSVQHIAILPTTFFGIDYARAVWKRESNGNELAKVLSLDELQSGQGYINFDWQE